MQNPRLTKTKTNAIKPRDVQSAWAMRYLSRMDWPVVADTLTLPEEPLREAVRDWIKSPAGQKVILSS